MKKLPLIFMVTSSVTASEFNLDKYNSSLDFAQVTYVSAKQSSNGGWCFNTSVRHNDQGWEHYADGWEVTDLKGNQVGYRKLGHTHDNEQPFTRSQCNIQIPNDISQVAVRAKCNNHGFGGKPVIINLNDTQSKEYSVKRFKKG